MNYFISKWSLESESFPISLKMLVMIPGATRMISDDRPLLLPTAFPDSSDDTVFPECEPFPAFPDNFSTPQKGNKDHYH